MWDKRLYEKAIAADEAWSKAGQRAFGRQWGNARYDMRGESTPELARLKAAVITAGEAWRKSIPGQRNPSSGAKQRARSVRKFKQPAWQEGAIIHVRPTPFGDRYERAVSQAVNRRLEAGKPDYSDGETGRIHEWFAQEFKDDHAGALARAKKYRPALPNPSSGAKQRARGVREFENEQREGHERAARWANGAQAVRRDLGKIRAGKRKMGWHNTPADYVDAHAYDLGQAKRYRQGFPLPNPAGAIELQAQSASTGAWSTVSSHASRGEAVSCLRDRVAAGCSPAELRIRARNPGGAKQRAHGTRGYKGRDFGKSSPGELWARSVRDAEEDRRKMARALKAGAPLVNKPGTWGMVSGAERHWHATSMANAADYRKAMHGPFGGQIDHPGMKANPGGKKQRAHGVRAFTDRHTSHGNAHELEMQTAAAIRKLPASGAAWKRAHRQMHAEAMRSAPRHRPALPNPSAAMALVYSPVNAAWLFLYHGKPTAMGDTFIFQTRQEAVQHAKWQGLQVASNGAVSAK